MIRRSYNDKLVTEIDLDDLCRMLLNADPDSSEETRWGRLRRTLPETFESRFKNIVDTLHISYFYYGDYPKNNPDGEFKRWQVIVRQFVDDLEQDAS
jgi:hypothetical protein